MSQISVYSFEDAEGGEEGWTTQNYEEAKEHAQKHALKIVENVYEWSEAIPLNDYTSSEADVEQEAAS